MTARRGTLAMVGAAGCLVAATVIAHATTRLPASYVLPGGIFGRRWGLFGQIAVWWGLFALSLSLLAATPRRAGVGLVLAGAVALRLAAVAPVAPMSDDLYRYAWDGKVQLHGTDPYRFAPSSTALAGLRTPWLWPDAVDCALVHRQPGCTRINRPDVRTVYPPVAQGWFTLLAAVGAPALRDRGYEAAGLLTDAGILLLLGLVQRRRGADQRWLALYAWCPLPVLEVVQNAHVDGLAALLALLAVALAGRPWLGGGLTGAAAMVKLYPAVLLALWLRRRPLVAAAAFGTVAVAGYLPHVLAVGGNVLGYLPAYLIEERYSSGSRYALVSLLGVHGAVASVVAALALFAAAIVIGADTAASDSRRALRLVGATLLVATPDAPWYAVLLVALLCLERAWWWLPTAFAAYPRYFGALLCGPDHRVGEIGWYVAAACVLAAAATAARRSQRSGAVANCAIPAPKETVAR